MPTAKARAVGIRSVPSERRHRRGESRPLQRNDVHIAFGDDGSGTAVRSARVAPARAADQPYNTRPFSKSGLSGEFRYLGCPSPSNRPPKAITRPVRSPIGKITLLRKKSKVAPFSACRRSPASISNASGKSPREAAPQRLPVVRRPAEPEASDRLRIEPPPRQVFAGAAARGRPTAGLVKSRRRLGRLEQGLLPLRPLALLRGCLRHRQVRPPQPVSRSLR